jgi:hypothetical protein
MQYCLHKVRILANMSGLARAGQIYVVDGEGNFMRFTGFQGAFKVGTASARRLKRPTRYWLKQSKATRKWSRTEFSFSWRLPELN